MKRIQGFARRFPWLLALVCAFCLFVPQFRSHAQTAGYTQLATVTSGTSYADTTCADGTTCSYEVTAVNSVGASALAWTGDAVGAGAQFVNVAVASTGTHTVTVSWTAPTTGGTPTSYVVYRAESPVPPTGLAAASN